jgi:hypothetical protein
VPNAAPQTVPAVGPAAVTVATPGGVLDAVQIPPVGVLDNTVHVPIHTLPEPEIAEGNGFTLTVRVT